MTEINLKFVEYEIKKEQLEKNKFINNNMMKFRI